MEMLLKRLRSYKYIYTKCHVMFENQTVQCKKGSRGMKAAWKSQAGLGRTAGPPTLQCAYSLLRVLARFQLIV